MSKERRTEFRKRPRGTRELIDENLKRVFQEMVDEELPEKLKDLLDRLEKADAELRKSK